MAASAPGMAAGRASEDSWRQFVERVIETLDVGPGTTSLFDVRCGGIDPSPTLVIQAKAAMPNGRWLVGDPATLDPAEPWDVLVAVSAFRFFKDLDQARGVLARMTAKATHAIAVLDVPEIDARHSDQLCFDRGWTLHTLADLDVSAVQIEDQRLDGDERARASFNVFARM